MEKDYRGREGGRIEVRRQSAVYFSLLSPGDGPGVNEGVKYSGKGQERRTLSDVKQLQRWDAARGTALLLKNAIRPSALIFIWSRGTLTFLRTSFWKTSTSDVSVMQILHHSLMNVGYATFRPWFPQLQISSRSWLPSVPWHPPTSKC